MTGGCRWWLTSGTLLSFHTSKSLCTVGPRLICTLNSFVNASFFPQSAHTLRVGGREAAAPTLGASGTAQVLSVTLFSQLEGPLLILTNPHFSKHLSVDLKLWGGTRITRWGLAKSRVPLRQRQDLEFSHVHRTPRGSIGPHMDGSQTVKAMPPHQHTTLPLGGPQIHEHARVLQVFLAAKKHTRL